MNTTTIKTPKLPGAGISNRPLHFFYICDCSGSMNVDGKIQALNYAVKSTIPAMRDAASDNIHAQVLVRALKFSSGAQWHIAQPTPVEELEWTDLTTNGVTDMGKALAMVAEQLEINNMPKRALPPVLVLITDGHPTDDFDRGLKKLMEQPWGKKAVRIGISIGQDADNEVLQKFIAHPELTPYSANNAEQLVELIKWASTSVLQAASSPASQSKNAAPVAGNVPIPQAPVSNTVNNVGDVW